MAGSWTRVSWVEGVRPVRAWSRAFALAILLVLLWGGEVGADKALAQTPPQASPDLSGQSAAPAPLPLTPERMVEEQLDRLSLDSDLSLRRLARPPDERVRAVARLAQIDL